MRWWQPVSFELRKPFGLVYSKVQHKNELRFAVRNNSSQAVEATVGVAGFQQKIAISARSNSAEIVVNGSDLVPGSNPVQVRTATRVFDEKIINWNISGAADSRCEKLDLSGKFNDKITNIFKEQYLSPRSPYPTLAVPVQGIGDWCSFKETELIEDEGLRKLAGSKGEIVSPQGVPFFTPGKEGANILFTSKWDNYPGKAELTLSGRGSHLYLLMAGSGHHMQSRMTNGIVTVEYADGTKDELPLVSPDNWWPIEQDFYEDGYAFRVDAVRPPRLYLKTGEWHLDSYDVLSKNKPRRIAGGAASLLDLPLNPAKALKSLTLETKTNDVVIGLMAATLKR